MLPPALGWLALPARAQALRVEISGVGASQIPLAIATFDGVAESAVASDTMRADLQRSGAFKVLPAALAHEGARPDFAPLRQQGADAYIAGSVTRLANGQLDLRYRLWDVVKGVELLGQSYPVAAADLRLAAHKVADIVQEKLTGTRGVAATRIAYVLKSGARHALVVADSDGDNPAELLISNEPVISPAWSPDGSEIAYVSFETRKPIIVVQTLATRARRVVANFRGINSAPAWSPDGKSLVVALSRDGLAQLYRIDAQGGSAEPQRLARSSGIDTEPAFGGGFIYFVSDRAGGPQIYRLPAAGGGEPQRVSFAGGYNISPAVSPDGSTLAYIARQGSAYKLHVQALEGGAAAGSAQPITDTAADESPSFAPNGKLLLYASRDGGREVLMATTLDGRVKSKLIAPAGDIREPAWGTWR